MIVCYYLKRKERTHRRRGLLEVQPRLTEEIPSYLTSEGKPRWGNEHLNPSRHLSSEFTGDPGGKPEKFRV